MWSGSFPYAADGQGERCSGREEITELVAGFLASVRDLRCTPPRLHRIADEDAVVAEFSGESTVISNGRRYSRTMPAVFAPLTEESL
jgi:hypothetical protein